MHLTNIRKNSKLPDAFLQIPPADRKAILEKAVQESGMGANVLEKDIWVCWTLQKLVAIPDIPPLAFKGGTSLSKIYNAISRFSEDVDVTIDRNGLDPNLDPFEKDKSRSRRKKDCAALDDLLTEFLTKIVKPYFDEQLQSELSEESQETRLEGGHGQLHIPYPSCFDRSGAYMSESILLELGGKNSIRPSKEHQMTSYLQDIISSVACPSARVPVLAAERTFWEKATLIHSECNRGDMRAGGVARMSRHWYDLAQLAAGEIGSSAIEDRDLLADVVMQKNVLYYAGYSNYEACSDGHLNLVPKAALAKALEEDFDRMEGDGMFWSAPGKFAEVIENVASIEAEINEKYRP